MQEEQMAIEDHLVPVPVAVAVEETLEEVAMAEALPFRHRVR